MAEESAPPPSGGEAGDDSALQATPRGKQPTPRRKKEPRELLEAQRRDKEGREYQLWQACGRQITSTRKTNGTSAFGAPRVFPNRRMPDPRDRAPGPKYSLPEPRGNSPTLCLKNFGTIPRFHQDISETGAAWVMSHNTNASPFSPVYPYQEAPPPKANGSKAASDPEAVAEPADGETGEAEAEISQGSVVVSPSPRRAKSRMSWDEAKRLERRQAHIMPDYNAMNTRFRGQPVYSFGSVREPQKRLFRDLRESIRS